jgi:hypothetical protein
MCYNLLQVLLVEASSVTFGIAAPSSILTFYRGERGDFDRRDSKT